MRMEARKSLEGKGQTGGGGVDGGREHHGLQLRALRVGEIRKQGRKKKESEGLFSTT